MYVSWDEFSKMTLGNTDPEKGHPDFTEETYERLAPLADMVIDYWTLDRVGKASKNGEELPESVVTLYCAIIEALPPIIEGSKPGKGGLVTSFSNGIDSYTFDTDKTMLEQLRGSIGWMVELLPVEWISACVSFEGGNAYAS